MNEIRSVEDRLRAEYFDLIPDLQRTLVALDSEIRHSLVQIRIGLDRYEQIRVVSRIKECASAIEALSRRQEGRVFDPEKFDTYSLLSLRDLVGIRVLVFPRRRIDEVRSALLPLIAAWTPDHVGNEYDPPLAFKYHGKYEGVSTTITAEVQIVSSLIGSYWEVEHSALYKTTPQLQGVVSAPRMQEREIAVYTALRDFEEEFERVVAESTAI
ncbi:MAG TPA: hypothetical protein VGJ88_03765 [Thermoanaerobaculia bacterium]|jgi:ppGpp synthetase/RelA/SpoT-type nucleotidyltranferase